MTSTSGPSIWTFQGLSLGKISQLPIKVPVPAFPPGTPPTDATAPPAPPPSLLPTAPPPLPPAPPPLVVLVPPAPEPPLPPAPLLPPSPAAEPPWLLQPLKPAVDRTQTQTGQTAATRHPLPSLRMRPSRDERGKGTPVFK